MAWDDRTVDAVAIDPGGASNDMADYVEQQNLRLAAILLTHAHLDHIEGVASLVLCTGAPVYLHPADRPLYDAAAIQAAQFGMSVEPLPPVQNALAHGQGLEFGSLTFAVRHVPGHSPGHVLFHSAEGQLAFVGDVVFQGSIGRTDLPGGNFQQLMQSIREQVLTLPASTQLHCGHGPSTTVEHEAVTNPFLVPNFRGGFA